MADTVTVGDFEYRRKDLIGHGAFAVVFKGRNCEKRDQTVAIKVITKKNLSKAQNLLTKEINILKGLKHENVVCLFDCKETSAHVNLVMEYCNGGDLADYLQAKGTLSEDTIGVFLRQIASAMKILQSKGIVHRDLKPQNILLSHSGISHPRPADIKIKIADFGFARFLHGEMMAATLCGSPMYMAPEVIMSREYDAKADLWSIGTIIYQCLTGRAPFMASTPQELRKLYEKSRTITPDIPGDTSSDLEDMLLGLLKRNPKDRIEYRDFFKHPFLAGALVRKPSAPVQVPLRKQSTRSPSSSPVGVSPGSRTPSDVRLDIFRKVTPPYDMNELSPSGCQYSPSRLDYMTARSPGGSKNLSAQDDIHPEEDFVMVDHQTSTDQSDGHICSNASDPLFPVFSSSPKPSKFHRPASPLTTGSQRKVTFTVGSPSSGSPSSSPLSRGLHNRSPSQNSPSIPQKPSPSNKTSTSGKSSPISIVGSSSQQTLPPCNDGYSKSAPIMVPHPRRTSFSNSLKSSQASPTSQTIKTLSVSPSSPELKISLAYSQSSPVSLSPKSSPSGVSDVSITPSRNQKHIPYARVLSLPENLSSSPSCVSDISTTPTPSQKHIPYTRTLSTPENLSRSPSGVSCVSTSPGQKQSPAQNQSPSFSPLVAVFSPYSPRKARASTDITFASLLGTREKPIVKARSSPSLSTTGAWALEAKSRKISPISEFDLKPLDSPPNLGWKPYRSPNAGVLARPTKTSLLTNVLGTPLSPSNGISEEDEMKPLKGIFFGQSNTPASIGARHFEGPVVVDVPPLSSETLMEGEHVEGVKKLRLTLSYANAIIDVVQTRCTLLRALSESISIKPTESCIGEQVIFVNDEYRKAEQLALCIKVLRLLNTMLEFAREAIQVGRLQPSETVKSLIKELNEKYHQCISRAKQINRQMSIRVRDLDTSALTLSADKLIYQHALEMCQIAALDELFGVAQQCKERYEKAALLLRSLEDGARSEQDRVLLDKYKHALDFRISVLEKRIARPKIVKFT